MRTRIRTSKLLLVTRRVGRCKDTGYRHVSELLIQIGVGGIFAKLILREVFAFLNRYRGGRGGSQKENIERRIGGVHERMWKVDKLYDWHNARDEEGVPVWYVRKSLEQAIKNLSASIDVLQESIREQNLFINKMIERFDLLHGDIKELRVGQTAIEQKLQSIRQQLKPQA